MTELTSLAGALTPNPDPSTPAPPPQRTRNPTQPPTSRPVIRVARSVTALDPTLLPEFIATAVAVDAHANALDVTLRRFNTLEIRLGRVMRRLKRRGCGPNEEEFAALLDYIGSSDVRVRLEELVEVFPP